MEHRKIYEEWKRKEKERSVGYEDGPYWQFLLAYTGVPVIGIPEIADSELACFSNNYPWAGYIVQTPGIPVWVKWGLSLQRDHYDGLFTSLFPMRILINKGKGRALESAWDNWGDIELQNNDETGYQSLPPPP